MEQIKTMFFSQYYGQVIMCLPGVRYLIDCYNLSMLTRNNEIKDAHLLLRSVKDLTDEELIRCYHLNSGAIGYDYTQDFADILTMSNHWIQHEGFEILFKYACTADYLRLIGILTPFTYLDENNKPITLSPDEIVKLGWATTNQLNQ